MDQYPYKISGGQQQKCACARALITEPKIIFADEPTGALDSASSKVLMETMCNMNKEFGITIMMVTHDANMASYANRILLLKDGIVYSELKRDNEKRDRFYHRILDIVSGEEV